MRIQDKIRADKNAIAQSVKNVNRILANKPEAKARFNEIMRERTQRLKTRGLGATTDTAVDSEWFDNQFMSDLFDFGVNIATHERIAADEQKQLELELAQIEAKNASLDKQLSLQSALTKTGAYGGTFIDELLDSPTKVAALLGLGGLLIWMQRGKK
jgi:hypothetical protein